MNDCYCTEEQFENLVEAAQQSLTTVVRTHNVHGRNHIKDKELYAAIGKAFLEQDQHNFSEYMQNMFKFIIREG